MYERRHGNRRIVVALNCTPVPRPGYRIGLSADTAWIEVLNTDSAYYAGGNVGNATRVTVEATPAQGCAQSALVTLPPLAAIMLSALV